MELHMLLEEYIKETQTTIAKILSMYDDIIKTSESIALEYVADEDSIEVDIEMTDADTGLVLRSIENSRDKLKEISIGLKQALERYTELSNVSDRRNERIKQLDGRIYEQNTGEKVDIDADSELRKLYAPLLEGLTESEIQSKLKQLKRIRGER